MKGASLPTTLDVDPCTLATFLAIVTGLAAVADPTLSALTIALVGLGLGAFLIGLRRRNAGRLAIDASTVAALSVLSLGGVAFFWAPPEVLPVRAFLLALSATPLWRAHRIASASTWGGRA